MISNQNISPREQEVLHLIAHENSSKQIAQELYISEHTVLSHRKNLMSKMKVKNTAGLIRKAFEIGFLQLNKSVALIAICIMSMVTICNAQTNEVELRTDGIVVPRTTTGAVVSPVEGMMIYSTAADGMLYFDGVSWLSMGSGASSSSASNTFDSLYVVQNGMDTVFSIENNIQTEMNFRLANSDTTGAIEMRTTDNPSIKMFDEDQNESVEIYSDFQSGITVRNPRIILTHHDENGAEVAAIQLNTNYQGSNDSRIITDELQIDGGSDLAELFDITNNEEVVEAGHVVSLDPNAPGKLMLSNTAYDKKVAGVLSGANGVKPGILMGQDETIATGNDLVTLSGRTYVMANTNGGEIKVGDLITTSDVQGEAMKAKNKKKAQGAIIGKAMTPLKGEKGYVLVLVNLQ